MKEYFGKLVTDAGRNLEGVTVELWPASLEADSAIASTTTDSDGCWRINAPEGDYFIMIPHIELSPEKEE